MFYYTLSHATRDHSTLRYGKVTIMSDSDLDGYHIRGLVINYIHFYWPWLMADFLKFFVTPCVIAGNGVRRVWFQHLQEYRSWLSSNHSEAGWSIRHVKGLASLTASDATELFLDFRRCCIEFKWKTTDGDLLESIFGDSKECVANRKSLLEQF